MTTKDYESTWPSAMPSELGAAEELQAPDEAQVEPRKGDLAAGKVILIVVLVITVLLVWHFFERVAP